MLLNNKKIGEVNSTKTVLKTVNLDRTQFNLSLSSGPSSTNYI